MLRLILGRAGSGKTEYARGLLKELAQKGEKGLCLMVPDQYSFESERAMLSLLGASSAPLVEVYGFSRLCENVFKEYGGAATPRLDDCGRTVIMRRALRESTDRLSVYKRFADSDSFTAQVLSLVTELKRSAVSAEDLTDAAQRFGDGMLAAKLRELSVISSAYDALANGSAVDPEDDLDRLYEKLVRYGYFKNKKVVFDSFKGFTGQQIRIIGVICAQADEVYITLPCDSLADASRSAGLFSNVGATALRLISQAQKEGVAVASPVELGEPKRFRSDSLAAAESGVFRAAGHEKAVSDGAVEIWSSEDPAAEADFAARRIVSLIREEGFRCREIAVIAREEELCRRVSALLDSYSVPCFTDRRIPLRYCPPARLCSHALDYLRAALSDSRSYNGTESLFRALKTGLCPISFEELTDAESYMRLWKLPPAALLREWTYDPRGFDSAGEDDRAEKLLRLNAVRLKIQKIFTPLVVKGRKAVTGADWSEMLWSFLVSCGADEALRKTSQEAEAAGNAPEAQSLTGSWDALMSVFDQLAAALPEETSLKEYTDMFSLAVSSAAFGAIPQGIDEVTVGTAERMRPASPRAVIILGANRGIFPASVTDGGLLTASDRSSLIEGGLRISDRALSDAVEERFLAYTALSAASERVIVSYSSLSSSGEEIFPSQIVTDLLKLIDGLEVQDAALAFADPSSTPELATAQISALGPALDGFAAEIAGGSVFGRSLVEALSRLGRADRAEPLLEASKGFPLSISPESARLLYGGDIRISPSAAENYFRCPFRYFCRNGLGAGAPYSAEIDSRHRGTVVHYVLEQMISSRGSAAFSRLTPDERRSETEYWLNKYLDEVLSGAEGKSATFLRQYSAIGEMLLDIEENMAGEFAQSRFETCYCELGINDGEKAVPMRIRLSDGSSIMVRGVVDRVDSYESGDSVYVRVVDYKTGKKELKAADVAHGLSLQMLIYLFTMEENGQLFNNKRVVPAAVLYMPVRSAVPIEGEKKDRMSGLMLNDGEFISALGPDSSKYFNISFYPNGRPYRNDSLVEGEVMDAVKERTRELLRSMGEGLKSGNIAADPLDGEEHGGCDYCDYAAACPLAADAVHRSTEKMKFSDLTERFGSGKEGRDDG